MKLAQIAPLYESVPPKLYGGTERIVSYLTEELVAANHDVTLFASADSITRARLVPASETALRLSAAPIVDSVAHYIRLLELVIREADQFDILHFHIDYLHFPWTKRQLVPAVTTLHGTLAIPDLVPLYKEFGNMNVISISDAQRLPLPWIGWRGTVYHGIPEDLYHLRAKPGEYLAFLGRICPEKRLDRAIEIAKRSGRKLKIAAKVDPVDRKYFSDHIKPLLEHPLVELIGEIGEDEKEEFLGNALALLFPIDWPDRLASIDRVLCRREFERRFTARRMTADYIRIYEELWSESEPGKKVTKLQGASGQATFVSPLLREDTHFRSTSKRKSDPVPLALHRGSSPEYK